MQKKWEVLNQKSEIRSQKSEDVNVKIKKIVDKILENRRVDKKDWEEFLRVPYQVSIEELIKLFEPEEMKKSLHLIEGAVAKNWPIVIHGDYDVDGLCATAILWETIHFGLGYSNVYPFIPHRLDHGYGLSQASLEEIASWNYLHSSHPRKKLLITVDCGITAVNEVEFAKNLGFEVLVLDHHLKPEVLPSADVILHTTQLCAAGIAYVLVSNFQLPTSNCQPLSLVALATIADLQPLLGLNRQLVRLGLKELNQTQRPGLQELIKIAGIQNRALGPYEVGFVLAPRLNAMGRLEHALESLRLLCTQNRSQAQELARRLSNVNSQRQRLTDEALQIAKQKLQAEGSFKGMAPIVLSYPNWHEGVIGLIAAKLTEEFNRPSIIISQGERLSKASARSINGFNILEAIRRHQEVLLDLGGHAMAAGFTLETTKIGEFSQKIAQTSHAQLSEKDLTPILKIDLELFGDDLSLDLVSALKRLEPYGIGNPRPFFLTKNLNVYDLKWMGKEGQHLKLLLGQKGEDRKLPAIGFDVLDRFNFLKAGDAIDLVYTLEENEFNATQTIQFKIKDLKRS